MARYSEYNLVQVAGLFLVATVISMGLIYFINAENQSRGARKGLSEHLGSPNRITTDGEKERIDAMALVMRDSTTTLSSSSKKSAMKKEKEDVVFSRRESLSSPHSQPSAEVELQHRFTSENKINLSSGEEKLHSSYVKTLVVSFYHRFINGLKRISNSLQETEGAEDNNEYYPSESTRLSPRIKRSLSPEERQTMENPHYSKIVGGRESSRDEESSGKNNVLGSNKNNNKRIRHVMKKILRQQQHKMYDDTDVAPSNEDNHRPEYKERSPDYLYDNGDDGHEDVRRGGGGSSDSSAMDSANYYYETGESPYGSGGGGGSVVGVGETMRGSVDEDTSAPQEVVEESSEALSSSNGLPPFRRKPSILLDAVAKDDMSINYLNIKRSDGRSMRTSPVQHEHQQEHVDINPITTDFCYKTDDVLIVVAITCCLNFTFVLGIWASVRWLGVGSSSKRRNRRMRAASSNATMKMVAFTEDEAEAFGEGPSHAEGGSGSIVGKKFLKPNHCCLSYDEEDDLFFTSSSEEDDEEEEDDDDETYYYGTDVKDNLVFDNKKDNQRRVFFNKRLSLRLAAASPYSKIRKRSRSMEDLRCSSNHLTVDT